MLEGPIIILCCSIKGRLCYATVTEHSYLFIFTPRGSVPASHHFLWHTLTLMYADSKSDLTEHTIRTALFHLLAFLLERTRQGHSGSVIWTINTRVETQCRYPTQTHPFEIKLLKLKNKSTVKQ